MIKKRILLSFFLMSISFLSFSQKKVSPEERVQWFKDASFGMMIHWGIYSELAGSYKEHTMPTKAFPQGNSTYAEWIQPRLEIPFKEYKAYAKQFNPKDFNADTWIKEAKQAGMKYFVITAKHHDGFALWDTKYSDFKVTNTPYKKDILKQLAEACKKYGIKLGFYYSHYQDWDHPDGAIPHWLPAVSDEKYEKYWQEKCLPQVKELLVNYNPDLLWFDTFGDEQEKWLISEKRRDELIKLVRDTRPNCLINGRISYLNPGDDVDFMEMMDNTYPSEIQKKPWQTAATMNRSWGYHAKDYDWKSSKQMLTYLIGNAAKGGNYLLNIGPKPDGTFPDAAVARLRNIGAWLVPNHEAIYNTEYIELPEKNKGVYFTQNKANKKVFAHLVDVPEDEVNLPIEFDKIKSMKILESGRPLEFKKDEKGFTKVTIPKFIQNPYLEIQVIQIQF